MRRFLTVLLFSAIGAGAQAQRLDPGDYIYPIRDVARLYSANFGEMRPGHFHAGIDIKTDGAEGKPLVAVADGYVSRVSLAAGGYGRAVYLTLRNGTTAVYGHLQRFRDDIEEHVRQERTARRANGVNLFFGPGTWPVKQGDVIGFSGDSGSSMGPHLHFEIRDTPTQRLYNVVREGVIRPEDNLPPRIMRLHYVEVDTLQGVPVRSRMESYAVVREAEGRYRLPRAEPVRRFPLPATAPAADAPFRRSCAPARAQNAPPARSVPAVFRIIPAFSTPHVLSAGSFALARAIYTAEKYFPLFFTKFTDLSFAFSEKYVMMKAHK